MHAILAQTSWQKQLCDQKMQHSAQIQNVVKGDVTYFRIRVEGAGQSWTVDRRYREFLALYAALPRQYEGGPRLPAMPPKSTFRKMLLPGFMAARVRGLDAVLHAAVAADPALARYAALRHFLGKVADQPSTSPCTTGIAQALPVQAVAAGSVEQAYPVQVTAQSSQALDYGAPSAPAYEAPTAPGCAEPAAPVGAQPPAPAHGQPAAGAAAYGQRAALVQAQPAEAAAPMYAPATQPAFAAPGTAPGAQAAVAVPAYAQAAPIAYAQPVAAAPVYAAATQPAFAAPGSAPGAQAAAAVPLYAPAAQAAVASPVYAQPVSPGVQAAFPGFACPPLAAPGYAPHVQPAGAFPGYAPVAQPAFAAPGQVPYMQPAQEPFYGQQVGAPMYAPASQCAPAYQGQQASGLGVGLAAAGAGILGGMLLERALEDVFDED
mmetsp:Transcript_120922/g.328131  ORF Transcript_120922/g.328131 Transcript_120922/m.328131 type:complete len:433 (-) Transcript_120922:188-1486(-)